MLFFTSTLQMMLPLTFSLQMMLPITSLLQMVIPFTSSLQMMLPFTSSGLLKSLEDLEVGGRVETIQMTALLRTARILRRVL